MRETQQRTEIEVKKIRKQEQIKKQSNTTNQKKE